MVTVHVLSSADTESQPLQGPTGVGPAKPADYSNRDPEL
jgi:hypothetical protein